MAGSQWTQMGFGEHREGGLIVKVWADPCPVCGTELTGLTADAIIVTDNPDSVLALPNPACLYDPEDPDSPECICTAVINPVPDPSQDRVHVIGWIYTAEPCGHRTERKIRMFRQVTPAPGTLGALIADWVALGGEPEEVAE